MPANWHAMAPYGKTMRRHFVYLDTILKKIQGYIEEASKKKEDVSGYIDKYMEMAKCMAKISNTIRGLAETSDIDKRLERIEDVLDKIPPEVLAQAKIRLGT